MSSMAPVASSAIGTRGLGINGVEKDMKEHNEDEGIKQEQRVAMRRPDWFFIVLMNCEQYLVPERKIYKPPQAAEVLFAICLEGFGHCQSCTPWAHPQASLTGVIRAEPKGFGTSQSLKGCEDAKDSVRTARSALHARRPKAARGLEAANQLVVCADGVAPAARVLVTANGCSELVKVM